MRFVDKDLLSVQEARILMENAGEARKVLAGFEQKAGPHCGTYGAGGGKTRQGAGDHVLRGDGIRKLAG